MKTILSLCLMALFMLLCVPANAEKPMFYVLSLVAVWADGDVTSEAEAFKSENDCAAKRDVVAKAAAKNKYLVAISMRCLSSDDFKMQGADS